MPGPPLSATFTYDGTPGNPPRSDKFNTLDREVVQSQRFFNSKQIGTHSRTPLKVNIPQNSGKGVGASVGGVISIENKQGVVDDE
jgi:hypothetical protein